MDRIDILRGNMKSARKKMGFTQERLAEVLGISPTHLKHIESGHRKPSLELLFLIAEVLDLSLDEIIFSDKKSANDFAVSGIVRNLDDCTAAELNILRDLIVSMRNNRIED